jgi:hypothetical protein
LVGKLGLQMAAAIAEGCKVQIISSSTMSQVVDASNVRLWQTHTVNSEASQKLSRCCQSHQVAHLYKDGFDTQWLKG